MAKDRVFSDGGAKKKSEGYHGASNFVRSSPDVEEAGLKSLNLEIPFEDAMKLMVALQSCVQSLNRYNRGTTKGKSMGVCLSIKSSNRSITVLEKAVNEPKEK